MTGYTKLYGKTEVTGKNDYETHLNLLKELDKRGFKVSAIDDLEQQAGITPPKKKPESKPKPKEEDKKPEKKEAPKTDDDWDLSL